MLPPFEYRRLGHFAYHVLADPAEIKKHLMHWIMLEWELDYSEAPHEHWTVEWMKALPRMEFALEVIELDHVQPRQDLMSVRQFQIDLKQRADEREEAMLRGVSLAPLLINRNGLELMDGYTRFVVLKRYQQKEVYAYVGSLRAG